MSSTLTEQSVASSALSVTAKSGRNDLTLAAVRYCSAGWPILPLCHPTADRLVTSRSPSDRDEARDWWSDQPYGIACRTGAVFDALQVPPWLGRRMLPAVEHLATVIEIERSLEACWLFLVTPGAPGIPDLPRGVNVRLRGAGDWILLPPTPTLGGSARWVARSPELRLPHSLTVQWSVVRAMSGLRQDIAANGAGRPATTPS